MDLPWLRRNFLYLRRFPYTPDHHGNSNEQIGGPVRRILLLLSLTIGLDAAAPSSDSQRGQEIFRKQGCVRCHSVQGGGSATASDLGRIIDRNFTPALLAS